jgi:hypothetical protein
MGSTRRRKDEAKQGLLVCSIVVVVFSLANVSNAVPISFIQTGTGSGGLDGSIYMEDATYKITDTEETRKRQSFSSGFYIATHTTPVARTGFGHFALTTATRTIVQNMDETGGFSRARSPVADIYVYHTFWLNIGYEYRSRASSRALGFNAMGLIHSSFQLGDPMIRRR